MTYQLGIDLGTTFSTAAVLREGRAEVLSLGTRSSAVPTVVLVRDDGVVLVGEPAEARGVAEPDRVAREFKRRLGDPTPLVLGGAPYGAERLAAYVLEHVIARATERMGAAPDTVVVTHPASYSSYRLELLREATVLAGRGDALLLPEPQAAAWHYAHDHRVERDETVAVFDFGGGTLDTAVVRAVAGGFELLGEPQGIDRFGGIDIDEAVFDRLREQVDDLFPTRPEQIEDPAWRSALARLRIECRTAKERLSDDTETIITVATPAGSQQVKLRRTDLEAMVRPRIGDAVRALERAVTSAGLTMPQVSRVLLVGGSSRIPLVRVLLAEATGRPIALDADPETTIALGAARWQPRAAASWPVSTPPPPADLPRAAPPPPPSGPPVSTIPPPPPPPSSPGGSSPVADGASSGEPFTASPPPSAARRPKRSVLVAAGAVAVLAAGAGAFVVSRGDDTPADPLAAIADACAELATSTSGRALPTTVDDARAFSAAVHPLLARSVTSIEAVSFPAADTDAERQLLVNALTSLDGAVVELGTVAPENLDSFVANVALGASTVDQVATSLGVSGGCIATSVATTPTTVAPTTTVPPTTVAPTTAAPTTVAPTTIAPTTVPVTAVPGVIQGQDLSAFFTGPVGLTLAPFDPAALQADVVDTWQSDPVAGPALTIIYGARILDANGNEIGQAFVFVGNQTLLGTAPGQRIVNEFITPPAAVSTSAYTSGPFAGTKFTLQSGTNGWVAPLGNSVTLVFGPGDQLDGLVDGFVAANSGRSLPGLV